MPNSFTSSRKYSPKRAVHLENNSTNSQNGSKSETSKNFLTPKGAIEAQYSKGCKRHSSTNPILLPRVPGRKQKISVNDSNTTNYDDLNLNQKKKLIKINETIIDKSQKYNNSCFSNTKNLKNLEKTKQKTKQKAKQNSLSSEKEASLHVDNQEELSLKFKFEPEQQTGPDTLNHIIFDPPIIKQFSMVSPPLKPQKKNCLCHRTPIVRSNTANSKRSSEKQEYKVHSFWGKKRNGLNCQPHKNLSTPPVRQKPVVRKASFELDQTMSTDENKIELGSFGGARMQDKFGNYLDADESNVETIVFKRKNSEVENAEVSGPVMLVASGFTVFAVTSFVIVKGLRNLFF